MNPTYNARLFLKRIENDNLVFPNKCAYCNKSLISADATINYHDLDFERLTTIPYCSEHKKSKPISRKQSISRKQFALLTVLLGLIIGILAGIFFYTTAVLVFRDVDLSIVGGFIIFTMTTAILYSLGLPFFKHIPQSEAYTDTPEAVRIAEVLPNAYILQFHNKEFANEFVRLNKDKLLRKSEITEHPQILWEPVEETDSVPKPTDEKEQTKTSRGDEGEIKNAGATEGTHSTKPEYLRASELKRLQKELNDLTRKPLKSEKFIVDTRSKYPEKDELEIYKMVVGDYRAALNNAKKDLANLTLGDSHVQARLLNDERTKFPEDDELEIYKTVIDRLRRDRRRT